MKPQTEYGMSVKLLGLTMICYGFIKGKLYQKSASTTGRRLGLFVATFYVFVGLVVLITG